jgi:hypothetical protein
MPASPLKSALKGLRNCCFANLLHIFTQGRPVGSWVLESENVVAETLAVISRFDDS